ncbi:MAG TPA: hypothetical protein VFB45_11320 [Pseudolabrys sp.]|nr:hypothetical protein [Pseudolabrys sp.]
MRWIRRNRQWGGRLALFALALQLILSFGHVHAEDLGLAAPAAVSQAQGASGGNSTPSHSRDAHDICAICVTLNLTAASSLPTVAALVLPVAREWDWPADIAATRAAFDLTASFQARAPPRA